MIPGSANSLLLASTAAAGGDARSVRFNSADSAFLSRTPSVAGNQKTWTWAGWVKRSGLGGEQALFTAGTTDLNLTRFVFLNDTLRVLYYEGSPAGELQSASVYRDTSAWYHIVFACDTTQSTASNRWKFWVNGIQLTSFSVSSYPAQGSDMYINGANKHAIGNQNAATLAFYLSGYLADIHFIDGQALTPTSFGEFDANGVWQPIPYVGTYPGNSFHLPFSDNSTAAALGTDASGNGNTWTVNNISVAAGAGNDSLVDTPTSYGTDTGAGGEVRGNYATLNPLATVSDSLSNGNLDWVSGIAANRITKNTIGMSSGKWYAEFTPTGLTTFGTLVGICTTGATGSGGLFTTGYGYVKSGNKYIDSTSSSYGATWTTNDVIGIALNLDASQLTFYKNGTSQGAISITSGLTWNFGCIGSSTSDTGVWNFGQRPFAYPVSGYKALCTTNLPAPVVAKPSEVMDVKLYTGNGSTQTISGLGFSPDLIWFKVRNFAYNHNLFDTVRGNTKHVSSNLTNAEYTESAGYGLTAFQSDGFSLGTDVQGPGSVNASGGTYAAWCWDAGSSTVTNTDGSITSSVRANASAGFSVLTVSPGSSTQVTIGHGLGVAPGFIIMKQRNSAGSWHVWHNSFTTSEYLFLNSTAAKATSTNLWGTSLPNSTVFGFNIAAGDWVAYCFAPVAGYSAFGSYTGNGSADGPFVYTGFRPRWVMIKRSDSASVSYGWFILDTARNTYNVMNTWLAADSSAADGADVICDTLANGFKIRTTAGNINTNAGTFVYACFAESPLQYARAR